MAKCPYCSESIDYLILEGRASNEFHPDGSWGTPEMDFDFRDEFSCPECGAMVVTGEANARDFLNPGIMVEIPLRPQAYKTEVSKYGEDGLKQLWLNILERYGNGDYYDQNLVEEVLRGKT